MCEFLGILLMMNPIVTSIGCYAWSLLPLRFTFEIRLFNFVNSNLDFFIE